MKKIILVQPHSGLDETAYVPLGLISLAAYVRDHYESKIVDLRFDNVNHLYSVIKETKPMAIGFSMLTGSCINQIINISKKVKEEYPEIKIIIGGIHPTIFPEQTISNKYIDYVIINEGERAFLELLRAIEENIEVENIKSLLWKDKSGAVRRNVMEDSFIDMNELPMPAWDLIDVNRYTKKLSNDLKFKVINFYTSKGCPFPCTFCYNLNFNKRKWRSKTAERAAEEVEFLNRKYGINYFIVHDDNFLVDKKRALRFAELIIEKKLDIKYSIGIRIDFFEHELLKKMHESGLCELRVGCESGSDRILKDVIAKGITAEQIIKAIKLAKDLSIKLILSFVVGWPTETIEERQKTIDLIIKLQRIHEHAAIYPLWIYIPYPGTTLFEKAVELGFKAPQTLEDWGNYCWGKANTPWVKDNPEYEMIHELSPFAWYNKKLIRLSNKSLKNILRHIFIKIFRPFVLYRFRNNFWKIPVDVRLAIFLKKFFQKSITNYEKFVSEKSDS